MLIGCLGSLAGSAKGQTLQHDFQIVFQNRRIGHILASQQGTYANRILQIRSAVQVRLVLNYQLNTLIEAEFRDGSLWKSSSWKKSNHTSSGNEVITQKELSGYEVHAEDVHRRLSDTSIAYSVADLYFTEPVNIRRVYSETEGRFLNLTPEAAHVYRLDRPGGYPNSYYYRSGMLVKVEARIKFGDLEFLKTDTP